MKTAKKILAGILAMTTLFSVGFTASCKNVGENAEHNAFIKELGGTSETYSGEVSQNSYSTEEAAALACVSNEISSYSTGESIVTRKKLNNSQILQLNLPKTETKDMLGVDELEMEYYISKVDPNEKKTAKIYIIKFANEFKYYTLRPADGEMVTKSYYNSVFNSQNYKNCTLNSTMEMNLQLTKGDETATATIKLTQMVKYSETAIYLEQATETTTETNKAGNVSSNSENNKVYGYMAKGVTWDYYISRDGEEWTWTTLSSFGVYKMSDLLPFAGEKMEYTYFTKTDYGFELTNENARRYIQHTLGQLSTYLDEDTVIDMFAKYYVCNGALSGMRMDMEMIIDVDYDSSTKITGNATAVAESKVTDYGMTVVEKPFE